MRAIVVYESLFGRTREVAEAGAEGLQAAAPGAAVDCRPVVDAGPALGQVDLLVVGGPTHFLGMSSQRSRRLVRQYQQRADGRRPRRAPGKHPAGPGVREWLAALPPAAGRRWAAAFDTRLSSVLPGSAARVIARSLEEHGYEVVARPEGFWWRTCWGRWVRGNATGRGRGDRHSPGSFGRHARRHRRVPENPRRGAGRLVRPGG